MGVARESSEDQKERPGGPYCIPFQGQNFLTPLLACPPAAIFRRVQEEDNLTQFSGNNRRGVGVSSAPSTLTLPHPDLNIAFNSDKEDLLFSIKKRERD